MVWDKEASMGRLDFEKTAVITGAASGIGRAYALAWAKRGFKIGIVDIDMDGAEETLALVDRAGGSGEVFRCNVRKLQEVQNTADHFFEKWGKIGLLVNNAGVADVGMVGDVPIEDWERQIETNLWGYIYGCHTFIPRMKEQGGGHIVNTASSAGMVTIRSMGPYNVAKAGIIALSETLKPELAPFNIGVTVVCPSFLRTNLLDTGTWTDNWIYDVADICMDGAKVTSDDIAELVVKAVARNRLYVFPQPFAKLTWIDKRMSPEMFYRLFAFLNKKGWDEPLLKALGKRGMV
jgi:NAD(P)-dependent dehydrogenase (short-subunit alcohol dehydrogenase family)